MKDVYKLRASDTIEALTTRAKIVTEMLTGKRPSDQAQATSYLREIEGGLEKLQELIDLG
jgi:hypothetical protein